MLNYPKLTLITQEYMNNLFILKEKIANHNLGDKKEAFILYNSLCHELKNKYGFVDKNYDEKPTKRGKEWLDIHHILEYQLDDIASRTEIARFVENRILTRERNEVIVTMKNDDFHDEKKREQVRLQYPNKNVCIYALDYTLQDLKLYNNKENLVYANQIEHFLLHYLIDSIRGIKIFSGGSNYLWDSVVALDIYNFDKEHLKSIQKNKSCYFSFMTSEEVTYLYKKLIKWKHWTIQKCERYWQNYKIALKKRNDGNMSYIQDTEKYFKLMDILGVKFL